MIRKPNDADSSRFPLRSGMSQTSTGLIVSIKAGDSAAWNRFAMLYTPLIRYWCRKPGGGQLSHQDRQDIAQKVLLKVHLSISEFDEKREGRSLRAWLRTITRNTIADHLEFVAKRNPLNQPIGDFDHGQYDSPFELEEEPEKEKIILLRQVMEFVKPEFPDRDWEIVHLFVNAEKTSSEVAQIMNMNGDTVRRIKNRIIARLRSEYQLLGLDDELPLR